MSQEALANAVSVSRQTIYNIETGSKTPNFILAFEIAKVLGVPVSELFTPVPELQELVSALAPPARVALWREIGISPQQKDSPGINWNLVESLELTKALALARYLGVQPEEIFDFNSEEKRILRQLT